MIEAVARRETDEDIDTYIKRHGLDGLAVALEYAREYVDDNQVSWLTGGDLVAELDEDYVPEFE